MGKGAAVVSAAVGLFPTRDVATALVDISVDTGASTADGAGAARLCVDASTVWAGLQVRAACFRKDTTAVKTLLQIGAALTRTDAGAIETLRLGAATTRRENAGATRALPLARAALV